MTSYKAQMSMSEIDDCQQKRDREKSNQNEKRVHWAHYFDISIQRRARKRKRLKVILVKTYGPFFVISFNVMPMMAIRQLIDIFYDYFICFVIVKNQFRM